MSQPRTRLVLFVLCLTLGLPSTLTARTAVAIIPLRGLDQTADSQNWGYTFSVLVDDYLKRTKSVRVLSQESIAGATAADIPLTETAVKLDEIRKVGEEAGAQMV